MLPKPKYFRSQKYLDEVKKLPCCVGFGCFGDIAAHHVKSGGKSIKCDDHETIPLCWHHHNLIHTVGKKTFERRFNVNLNELVKETMIKVIKAVFGGWK